MGNEVAPRKEFIVQGAYEVDAERHRRLSRARPVRASRPVSTSYMKPPTSTVSGISGWARILRTSSTRAALVVDDVEALPRRVLAGGLGDPRAQLVLGRGGHRAAGVRDDQDPVAR